MARASVNISLDAELVVEAMVLSGIRNAQDAVEAVVRDYVANAHRTEAVVGDDQAYHRPRPEPRDPDAG